MIFNRKTLRRLHTAIHSIRSRDLTLHFALDKLRGEERKAVEELNGVVTDLRDELARIEAQYGCFSTMLDKVDTALIIADENGKVLWMNASAVNGLCGFRIPEIGALRVVCPDLPLHLASLKPGEQKLLNIKLKDHDVQWKISVTIYMQGGSVQRLYSIENVHNLIQQSEVDAQKKLLSVLTHEIMNSLSPIISLSDSLCANPASDPLGEDGLMALEAIHRRSKGLLNFIEHYRSLSRLAAPTLGWVRIGDMFQDISTLIGNQSVTYNVEDSDIELLMDRVQMEQVIINLLKNAIEACQETSSPVITISTHADFPARHYLISVNDNGSGIAPEAIDNIFIPFFTTKPQGAGIGLSLSRQIVTNHGGLVKVQSVPGSTTFTIQLPLNHRVGYY